MEGIEGAGSRFSSLLHALFDDTSFRSGELDPIVYRESLSQNTVEEINKLRSTKGTGDFIVID